MAARQPSSLLWVVACWAVVHVCLTTASPLHELFLRQQNVAISANGSCGGTLSGAFQTCLGSTFGNCCSRIGFCGNDSSYCGAGCQSSYGLCGDSNISTDGSCGGTAGLTCRGAVMGNCCSAMGFCGSTANYCGTGCQREFGDCLGSAASASTSTSGPRATSDSQDQEDGGEQQGGGGANDGLGLKVGLGVGIPAGLLAIAASAWLLWRRRRQSDGAVLAAVPLDEKMDGPDDRSTKTPESNSAEIDGVSMPAELSIAGPPQELPTQVYR